jgi:hypothetical protein
MSSTRQKIRGKQGGNNAHIAIGASDIYFKIFGKASNGIKYGFDISSIYHLFYNDNHTAKNPYNRNPLNVQIYETIQNIIRIYVICILAVLVILYMPQIFIMLTRKTKDSAAINSTT